MIEYDANIINLKTGPGQREALLHHAATPHPERCAADAANI